MAEEESNLSFRESKSLVRPLDDPPLLTALHLLRRMKSRKRTNDLDLFSIPQIEEILLEQVHPVLELLGLLGLVGVDLFPVVIIVL